MSKKKSGLGRGIDALFQVQVPVEERRTSGAGEKERDLIAENVVTYLDIDYIKPNRFQPRKIFNDEALNELANSITTYGVIQPLIVQKQADRSYELVAGERRWRASRLAGLKKVPVIIKSFSDEENMVIAIVENLQREDLNPIEEAEGLGQIINKHGFTQEQVAKAIGKSRSYIANSLRLLNLSDNVKQAISDNKISSGHGRALLALKNKDEQERLCIEIIEKGLTVRDVEGYGASQKSKKSRPAKKVKSPDVLKVESELKELFGTKVTIVKKGKKGTLEIDFFGDEDLNRIIDMMRSLNL